MGGFFGECGIDKTFTIGKVAFGETDYLELSAYFSLIIGISLAIYFQLFRSIDDVSSVNAQSPIQKPTMMEATKVTEKMTDDGATPSAPTQDKRSSLTLEASCTPVKASRKKLESGCDTPRRSERIQTRTPIKRYEE